MPNWEEMPDFADLLCELDEIIPPPKEGDQPVLFITQRSDAAKPALFITPMIMGISLYEVFFSATEITEPHVRFSEYV